MSQEEEIEIVTPTGFPVPFVKVKIVDDNNQEVKTGEIGEIVVRTPWLTKGYYKLEENQKNCGKAVGCIPVI